MFIFGIKTTHTTIKLIYNKCFFLFLEPKKFRHIILFDDGYGTTSLLTLLHFNLSRNQCGALIPYFGCDWISLLIFWHGLISLSRNFKMKGNFFVAWLGVSILTDLYPSMQLCVIINSSIFLIFIVVYLGGIWIFCLFLSFLLFYAFFPFLSWYFHIYYYYLLPLSFYALLLLFVFRICSNIIFSVLFQ